MPPTDSTCAPDENFIHCKQGYCYYACPPDKNPIIYNLFVEPAYRHQGHARRLLKLVITDIRRSGCMRPICIEARPKEGSISLATLTQFYSSLGLVVIGDN